MYILYILLLLYLEKLLKLFVFSFLRIQWCLSGYYLPINIYNVWTYCETTRVGKHPQVLLLYFADVLQMSVCSYFYYVLLSFTVALVSLLSCALCVSQSVGLSSTTHTQPWWWWWYYHLRKAVH